MRILLWLIMAAALVWAVRELTGSDARSPGDDGGRGEEMVRDPVCGVYVPKSRSVSRRTVGEKVYFCSRECEKKYSAGR
ncbi:MAG: PP0621 family protein [bacterium]|nr:PP0621 family protein [bacterium]